MQPPAPDFGEQQGLSTVSHKAATQLGVQGAPCHLSARHVSTCRLLRSCSVWPGCPAARLPARCRPCSVRRSSTVPWRSPRDDGMCSGLPESLALLACGSVACQAHGRLFDVALHSTAYFGRLLAGFGWLDWPPSCPGGVATELCDNSPVGSAAQPVLTDLVGLSGCALPCVALRCLAYRCHLIVRLPLVVGAKQAFRTW